MCRSSTHLDNLAPLYLSVLLPLPLAVAYYYSASSAEQDLVFSKSNNSPTSLESSSALLSCAAGTYLEANTCLGCPSGSTSYDGAFTCHALDGYTCSGLGVTLSCFDDTRSHTAVTGPLTSSVVHLEYWSGPSYGGTTRVYWFYPTSVSLRHTHILYNN